ncbi:hypothetical protein CsSME_00038665 [Camellia sinensis var. sinensis]
MTKVDAFRRFVVPCCTPAAAATTSAPATKKRLSHDDIEDPLRKTHQNADATQSVAPSETKMIRTIFSHSRGHLWFCIHTRFLLPCFNTSSAAKSTTKKRPTTSILDDVEDPLRKNPEGEGSTTHRRRHVWLCIRTRLAFFRFLLPGTTTCPILKNLHTTSLLDVEDPLRKPHENCVGGDGEGSSTTVAAATLSVAPLRFSKMMVIGTIFGHRRGHVWFCVQPDRHSTRPTLLLELPTPTFHLIQAMRAGPVRITLECRDQSEPEMSPWPLRSVLVWTMLCNGRKLGLAVRRKATEANQLMLKTMRNITTGAGVIPSGLGAGSSGEGELMFMRGNYECVVGGPDSESFHLINPDESPGQELSIFLLR